MPDTTLTPAQVRALRFYAAPHGDARAAIGSPRRDVIDRLADAGLIEPEPGSFAHQLTDTGRAALPVTVEVSNTYACGRESGVTVELPAPPAGAAGSAEDDGTPWQMREWWEDVVHEHTGDGHPCGSREHALYEATVTDAPGRPELVGSTYSWEG